MAPVKKRNCDLCYSNVKVKALEHVALNTRHEALRDLVMRARSQPDLADLTAAICSLWRFVANVSNWRVLCRMDQEFIVVDSQAQQVTIAYDYQLSDLEKLLWSSRIPRHLKRKNKCDELIQLEELLHETQVEDVAMLPLDPSGRGLQFYLIIASGPFGFSRLDLKFIQDVGMLLAREMSDRLITQKLMNTLQQNAREDSLTRLANRRYFEEVFDVSWRNATRNNEPLSLLMIDVDHFKIYNDTFGHVAGDACLRAVADAIRSAIRRPLDFCARMGGEEFGVLLPNTREDGAIAMANRIIAAVDALTIPHMVSGFSSMVSVSIGSATCVPKRHENSLCLVEAADEALYEAKSKGRHQVRVAQFKECETKTSATGSDGGSQSPIGEAPEY